MTTTLKPVVGLTADLKTIAPHNYHSVGDKYLRAVATAAESVPLVIPALGELLLEDVTSLFDGLVLTGSYANLHPQHYGGGEPLQGSPLDLDRDAVNLRLVPAALEAGVPILGICRGFQEINVALGGTLHQQVHEVPEYDNHLENPDDDLDTQYGPSHPVHLTKGGRLAGLADSLTQAVNSLHGQGIDRLASGVNVEARSPDGLVEAFTVADAKSFALAVQWHPEWKPLENPFYAAIWRAFGDACRRYRARRSAGNKTD